MAFENPLFLFVKMQLADKRSWVKEYRDPDYVCSDFAKDVVEYMTSIETRCAYTILHFDNGMGHAIVAFDTDCGLVYFEPQTGEQEYPAIGKRYSSILEGVPKNSLITNIELQWNASEEEMQNTQRDQETNNQWTEPAATENIKTTESAVTKDNKLVEDGFSLSETTEWEKIFTEIEKSAIPEQQKKYIKLFQTTQCSWCKKFYTTEPFLCPYKLLQSNCLTFERLNEREKEIFARDARWWWRMQDMIIRVKEKGVLTRCQNQSCLALNPNPNPQKRTCWKCGRYTLSWYSPTSFDIEQQKKDFGDDPKTQLTIDKIQKTSQKEHQEYLAYRESKQYKIDKFKSKVRRFFIQADKGSPVIRHKVEGNTCPVCKSTYTMIKQGRERNLIQYYKGQRSIMNYCINCGNNFYTVDLPPYGRK